MRHLVRVQFGDRRAAVERIAAGGATDFYGQVESLAFDVRLAQRMRVTVVCVAADYPVTMTPDGVHAAGLDLYGRARARHGALIRLVRDLEPTHLLVGSPLGRLLAWSATQPRLSVLPCFADSFHAADAKARLRGFALARILGLPKFEAVANHNLPAALDLVRLGVDPAKVVAWDYPNLIPDRFPPKPAPDPRPPQRLLFVGKVSEAKGVPDILRAAALLRARDEPVEVSVAGDPGTAMPRLARALEIDDVVTFLGRVPHHRIPDLMHEHDAVVVASRSAYPEGFPMTLLEALMARTPLIASDHPMLAMRLRDRRDCVQFEAGNPRSLADAASRLRRDGDMYERLSEGGPAIADRCRCPLDGQRLVETWLDGTEAERHAMVREHALTGPHHARALRAARPQGPERENRVRPLLRGATASPAR